jgi:hypothetical protein
MGGTAQSCSEQYDPKDSSHDEFHILRFVGRGRSLRVRRLYSRTDATTLVITLGGRKKYFQGST